MCRRDRAGGQPEHLGDLARAHSLAVLHQRGDRAQAAAVGKGLCYG